MTWKIATALMVALLLGVALTGCSMAAEEATEALVESGTGADVEIDDDGESVSIETEDGSIEISGGESATLPDGFPEDMPVYDGQIVMAQSVDTPEGTGYNVGIQTSDSEDDVAAWYSDELANEGWTIAAEISNDGDGMMMTTYQVEKNGSNSQVVIAEEDGQTQIVLTVTYSD